MLLPELTVGGEGACQTFLVTSAPELSVGVERARRGRRRVLNGACRVVPGIIRRGRGRASDVTGCVGPRYYPSGSKECVKRCLSLRPQNYLLGARERVGRVWLRESASAVSGCVGMRVTDGTGCAGPGIIRRGSRRVLNGVCCFGPRIICRGQENLS